jgi:hypothetical protein
MFSPLQSELWLEEGMMEVLIFFLKTFRNKDKFYKGRG